MSNSLIRCVHSVNVKRYFILLYIINSDNNIANCSEQKKHFCFHFNAKTSVKQFQHSSQMCFLSTCFDSA